MCDGVTFQAEAGKKGEVSVGGVGVPTAGSLTAAEEKLLKACLGDADGDASNNLEVYNWDYGTANTTFHPHIVKIVKTPGARTSMSSSSSSHGSVVDDYDAGKYYLAYYGTPGTSNEPAQFMFAGLPPTGADLSIFTTDGTATLLGNATEGAQGAGGGGETAADHEPRNQALTARFAKYGTTVYTSTDVSCDTANSGAKKHHLNAYDRGPLLLRRRQGHQLGRLRHFGAQGLRHRRRPDGLDPRPHQPGPVRRHGGARRPGHRHGARRQVLARRDVVRVRPAVLGPRPLQRRRRPLRVLHGLHERQLRPAVRACRLERVRPLPGPPTHPAPGARC